MLPHSLTLTWAVRDGRHSAPALLPRRLTTFVPQPPLSHAVIRTAASAVRIASALPRALARAWAPRAVTSVYCRSQPGPEPQLPGWSRGVGR